MFRGCANWMQEWDYEWISATKTIPLTLSLIKQFHVLIGANQHHRLDENTVTPLDSALNKQKTRRLDKRATRIQDFHGLVSDDYRPTMPLGKGGLNHMRSSIMIQLVGIAVLLQ